jgi:hypothetical protein
MSYRNLEIWQLAREIIVEIHRMTLNKLLVLGRKISSFIDSVERGHHSDR